MSQQQQVKPITVEEFVSQYRSKSTKRCYACGLRSFFNFIYESDEILEEKAQKYFTDNRDFSKDVPDYLTSMSSKPPKTVSLYISAIKMYMLECGVEMSGNFWRKFNRRRSGRRARTEVKVPDKHQIKMILGHTPIQGKALFLLLASSGMRIGEALQLQIDDLDLKTDHVYVRGEYTKTNEPRHVFFTDETKEYLEEWLKNRDRYVKQARGRTAAINKKGDDSRLFPFDQRNARVIWNNACLKTGNGQKDKVTNRRLFHPHVLRKFFRSQLATVVSVDIVEALMGHEGYLTEVYRKYSVEQLRESYKKGEHTLRIFSNGEEITKLRNEVEERTKTLEKLLSGIMNENFELKHEIGQVKQQNEKIQNVFTEITDRLFKRIESLELDREQSRPPSVLDLVNKKNDDEKMGLSQNDIDDVMKVVRELKRKKRELAS